MAKPEPNCFNPKLRTYNQDGLITMHSCGFRSDSRFQSAYEAGEATGSWGRSRIHWRVHVACWAASQAAGLPGDFVECGTNKGGMALSILKYLAPDRPGQRFFLFDTFSGLVPELSSSQELAVTRGFYGDCYEEVVRRFAPYPNIVIVRGVIPASLTKVPVGDVAFVHMDLNAARPTRSAIEFFWPKLLPGGIVLLDDYGWIDNELQKATLDEFAALAGVEILCLPTGQGLLLKPHTPGKS
jgi:hypothetical protein